MLKKSQLIIVLALLVVVLGGAIIYSQRSRTEEPEVLITDEMNGAAGVLKDGDDLVMELDAEMGLDGMPEDNRAEDVTNNEGSNLESPSRESQYVLFYGETCPYCHDVLDWMKEVNLESRINIVTKEVYNNPQFSEQMNLAARTCGQSRSGVPFLYDSGAKECVVGSTPIIEYLSEVAGV